MIIRMFGESGALIETHDSEGVSRPMSRLSVGWTGKRCPISGLSRSILYQLAALGKIGMISLRRESNSQKKVGRG